MKYINLLILIHNIQRNPNNKKNSENNNKEISFVLYTKNKKYYT